MGWLGCWLLRSACFCVYVGTCTESTRSTNKSSSTSVGVSFGIGKGSSGLSVDVAASRGKGQANSDSTTYNNSHVTAGQQVSITSGSDTNIVGGNVTAQQVTATVGGNLNVQSLQDVATSKNSLSDSNGKAVSSDTSATNRTLAKADVAGLQQQAQQKQAENNLVFKAATAFTDPAFKAAFLDQAKMYKKVPTTDDKGNASFEWKEMSPEEKAQIPPGSRIANNGIFNGGPNDPSPAQNLAQQNSSGEAQYLVHFPEANNRVSELLVAGYQKFLEGSTMGLTNATQQNVDLWKQTGGDITLDGHSRGGMTVGNALTAVQEQGGQGGVTNVNLFGSAYNAQDAANTVNQITNGQGKVTSQVHKDDFVGTVLGGNTPTGGTTPSGSSTLQEWIRILGGESTAHNNYGDGKKLPDGQGGTKSGTDDYWGGVKPESQLIKPTPQILKSTREGGE